ncbi:MULTISPECIES: methyltransferase domain-containing protein [unclassified Methanoregula]|uniref:methyltransferase domain-containing protein n=1 Tax=unclassified Methanoregula TaxID=2649730 RepID=UPI0009CFBDE0|nr:MULTISPECIES: methyltransferase domain-containing protein [unclassified Methanoregula]OPX61726.1 MAG: trans-aconitate 2-methyltransferase [Methanoregula sp. PtaB.Bin085]OPY33965.1 MAG: trans-aconitate 2-methyltransferase [Methanoregula sp. PtaU1.Bin006]
MQEPDLSTKLSWDAKEYSHYSAFQEQCAQEVIGKLDLRGSEHILDIGCGDGRSTAEIARRLHQGRILGIDASAEMIQYASSCYPAEKYPNLSFAVADARALEYRDEFDVIFSNAALHWITDHRPVLKGIFRALRPGGKMLAQMAGKGNAAEAFLAFAYLVQDPPWNQFFTSLRTPWACFGPEQYREWVLESGLKPVRLELIRRDMVHANRESFTGWIRTTWLPHLDRIPVSLRPAFIDALYEMCCKLSPPDSDGVIRFSMVRLEVEAEKPV